MARNKTVFLTILVNGNIYESKTFEKAKKIYDAGMGIYITKYHKTPSIEYHYEWYPNKELLSEERRSRVE